MNLYFCWLIFLYEKISSCIQLISDNAKAKTVTKGVNAMSVCAMGKGLYVLWENEYQALNRLLLGI